MNTMGTYLFLGAVVLCCLVPEVHGVDGIALSTQWRRWFPFGEQCGDIMRYDIKNDDIVSSRVLFDGAGGDESRARVRYYYPTISRDGSLVAFARVTSDSGFIIASASIDGTNVRNLVRLGGYTENPIDFCRVEQQDWVYYKGGGGAIRRVDARDPARDETVVTLATSFWQWEMSADGSRLHAGAGTGPNRSRFQLPCDGSIGAWNKAYQGGCGCSLSPSGNTTCYFNGVSGHMIHDYVAWDRFQSPPDTRVTWMQVEDWNTNTPRSLCSTCDGAGYTDMHPSMCIGCAGEGHRWSCNSDKWLCILMTLDGAGWSGWCGANQVIINHETQVSINVSKNARACVTESNYLNMSRICDKDAGYSQYKYNDCGDFWVSGPTGDTNPDLRFGVGSLARADRFAGESVQSVSTKQGLAVSVRGTGDHRVALTDPSGRLIAEYHGSGSRLYQLPRAFRGMGIVTVARNGSCQSQRVCLSSE